MSSNNKLLSSNKNALVSNGGEGVSPLRTKFQISPTIKARETSAETNQCHNVLVVKKFIVRHKKKSKEDQGA